MKTTIKIVALTIVAMFAFGNVANAQKKVKLAIPKPDSKGAIVDFKRGETVVAKWNPATLELTMTSDGAVFTLDPKTGQMTDKNGASRGSMSADGTIESPLFGTLKLVQDTQVLFFVNKGNERLGGIVTSMGEAYYGDRRMGDSGHVSDQSVNPLLMAYVYFGLIFTQDDLDIKSGNKSRTYEVRNWKTGQMMTVTDKELGGFVQKEGGNVLLKKEDMLITSNELYQEEVNWKNMADKKSIIGQILSDDKFDNRKRAADDLYKDRKIVAVLFKDTDWKDVYSDGQKTDHSVYVIIVSELANGMTRADWVQYIAAYKGWGEYSETIRLWSTAKHRTVIDWEHKDDADPLTDL